MAGLCGHQEETGLARPHCRAEGFTWPQSPCCGCGVSRRYWPPWEGLSGQEELFLGAPWDLATCGCRFPRCKSNPKGVAILFTAQELPHLEQEEHF